MKNIVLFVLLLTIITAVYTEAEPERIEQSGEIIFRSFNHLTIAFIF